MAQISLCGKVQADIEIKVATDKFHEVFRFRPYLMSKASPDKVKSVDLHEGQWGNEGSVVCWNYVLDGKSAISKEIVETMDNKNYSATYKEIGGDLLEHYKSFKFIYQTTPKGDRTVVRYTLEYEKLNENTPDPNKMLDVVVSVIKDMDAYLTKV